MLIGGGDTAEPHRRLFPFESGFLDTANLTCVRFCASPHTGWSRPMSFGVLVRQAFSAQRAVQTPSHGRLESVLGRGRMVARLRTRYCWSARSEAAFLWPSVPGAASGREPPRDRRVWRRMRMHSMLVHFHMHFGIVALGGGGESSAHKPQTYARRRIETAHSAEHNSRL